jgi:putative phosphoesterase
VKILVLSDTHIPRTAADLPAEVYEAARKADMVLHAGDFTDAEVLDKLNRVSKVCAVYGNMDDARLRGTLTDRQVVQAGRFKIGLIHGYGAPAQLIDTVAGQFTGVDAVVFGHSHSATNVLKGGVLFFNPGSPTDTVFASRRSYGLLEVGEDKIEGRIIEL